jgi:malate dehydrogenase
LPCATYLNGEYKIQDLYVGVPVIIGKKGVEKVIKIDLNKEEEINLEHSVEAVKDLFDAAKKIDPFLA